MPKADRVALSPAQERLWFLDQFIPNRSAYNIAIGYRIRGRFDVDVLEKALTCLTHRHPTLRSAFSANDSGNPLAIAEAGKVSVRRAFASSQEEALALANHEAGKSFQLSSAPLLRCLVISMTPDDQILVMNVHHIASDGWSMGILMRELTQAYNSIASGSEASWSPIATSYPDYAAWQRSLLEQGALNVEAEYWKRELLGAPSLLDLPTDKVRPSVMSYKGRCTRATIDSSTRRSLELLAAREACTPFMVLLAAWKVFLHRYSQQQDIVVGVPVAGRNNSALEKIVGCFVNTLAVRTHIDSNSSFLALLQTVRERMMGALAHQDLPFEILVRELGLERDLSRSPLFQVMLVLQNPNGEFLPSGAKVSPLPLHNGGAKCDLVLEVTPTSDTYDLALEFDSALFLPETAARMLRHFVRLLENACKSPETSLSLVPMMGESENSGCAFVCKPEPFHCPQQ